MSQLVMPNAMFDLRYWLRNQPDMAALNGGRAFFRLPDTLVAPFFRLSRTGGAVQTDSEAPIWNLQLLVEAWGLQNSDYTVVTQLTMALEHACQTHQPGTLINPTGNTILDYASVSTSFDSPDPDTGWPRTITHVVVTVKASVPTTV